MDLRPTTLSHATILTEVHTLYASVEHHWRHHTSQTTLLDPTRSRLVKNPTSDQANQYRCDQGCVVQTIRPRRVQKARNCLRTALEWKNVDLFVKSI